MAFYHNSTSLERRINEDKSKFSAKEYCQLTQNCKKRKESPLGLNRIKNLNDLDEKKEKLKNKAISI